MDWTLFPIFFAACAAAATTGAMFPPDTWYRRLTKPRWTPPDWVFPVTWTTLYVLIALAATRVAPLEGSAHALAFWSVQMVLNALWSPVFFGQRRLRGGMIAVVALWLAVFATMVSLWRLDTVAGLLFVPYLIWVSIAASLNFAILRANPEDASQPT